MRPILTADEMRAADARAIHGGIPGPTLMENAGIAVAHAIEARYGRERRVIWAGFAALAFASLMAFVVVNLPPAPNWPNQKVYETAFGSTWRIAGASIIAFLCGSFVNAMILAKMKVWTAGKHLWARTIGSTIGGEAVDSALFYPLAFYNSGIMPNELVWTLVFAQFLSKTFVVVAMTPVTYKIVGFLKRVENEDYYDKDTDFSPFHIKV